MKGQEMALGNRYGQMARCMKGSGVGTRRMAWGDLFTQMETSMKESGSMTKRMDLVCIRIWMGPSILDNGRKTNNMDRGRKAGLMELCMKETMSTGRNKVKATSNGQTAPFTQGSSSTTTLKASVSTDGLMAEATMESGGTTRCMGKACSHGLMGGSMRGNTLKTRSRDWECFSGQMEDSMWGSGPMGSSMGEAHSLRSMDSREMESGTTGRDSDGLMTMWERATKRWKEAEEAHTTIMKTMMTRNDVCIRLRLDC